MGRGQELLNAAREGDLRTVEKILDQITNISGPFTSFKNILQVGKSRAVELDKGADKQDSKLENPEDPNGLRRGAGVNVQDDNGYTPLHQACLNDHKEIVRVLLAVGASPCIVDKKGATPLHLAAFKGDTELCWLLLQHNNPPCNVDQVTADHETALLIAAQFGYVNVVAMLVAKGANVSIKNNNDESALDLAAQYGRLPVVEYLLRLNPRLVDQYRHPACRNVIFTSTPLHRASKNGRKDVVTALIDAGVDPNVRTHSGTPLHEAARFGKPSVVRILLAKGADLHAQDSDRKTVYDLLNEYPEEATRKVRKVIRGMFQAEYENVMGNFDSDKECPPFPVQDYSPDAVMSYCDNPTAQMLNPKINASPDMGNDRKCNIYVTNPVPSPEARTKTHVIPLKSADNNRLSIDMRERSQSFVQKAKNNKQLMFLGTTITSETACTKLVENQNQLISEFKSRNKSKAGPDSEKEVSTVVQTARNNLVDSSERMRRSTMDHVPRNKVTTANDFKKKPQLVQKPIAYVSKFDPQEDHADNIYANNCVFKNNFAKKNDYVHKNDDFVHQSNDYSHQNNDYSDQNDGYSHQNNDYGLQKNDNDHQNNVHQYNDYVHTNNNFDNNDDHIDNIYENVSKKFTEDVVDTKETSKSEYVIMHGKSVIPRSATFGGIRVKPKILAKSLDNNVDDCRDSEGNPGDYVSMDVAAGLHERSLSVQFNKTDLVHLRGDIGCVYESPDYSYIYEVNPYHGHGQPFTKTKHKANPMPCYCHEDPYRELKVTRKINARTRPISGSQNVYYSCEDIYVSMKTKEGIYSSLNELSGYGKKKMADDEKEANWPETEGTLYKFDDSGFNESNEEKSQTLDGKTGGLLKKKLLQVKQLIADW